MATVLDYNPSTNSLSISSSIGSKPVLVPVAGSGIDNNFSVPQTFGAAIIQPASAGANNSSPFAQYGDLFSDAIVTTPAPAFPTSETLSSTAPALDAYVLGQRVAYAGGSYTVGASATSYLDLSNTGVLTVSTSGTVTADSLRLATVTSSATAITGVVVTADNYFILGGVVVGRPFGSGNYAAGVNPLQSNTIGNNNYASGTNPLQSNTTGSYNYAAGFQPLQSNTIGSSNYAAGFQPLYYNTTGSSNYAAGFQSLLNNTTGSSNYASGWEAGFSNVSGNGSVFIGYQAGYSETLSNKLYISNSNTPTPLIYGDFGANYLTINGDNVVTGQSASTFGIASTTRAGAITVTAAQLWGRYFSDGATQAAAFTVTTDTAANILAAVPNAVVGTSLTWRFINNDQSSTGYAGTLAGGTGVTVGTILPNPAVPRGGYEDYVFTFTGVGSTPAITVNAVGGNSAALL